MIYKSRYMYCSQCIVCCARQLPIWPVPITKDVLHSEDEFDTPTLRCPPEPPSTQNVKKSDTEQYRCKVWMIWWAMNGPRFINWLWLLQPNIQNQWQEQKWPITTKIHYRINKTALITRTKVNSTTDPEFWNGGGRKGSTHQMNVVSVFCSILWYEK